MAISTKDYLLHLYHFLYSLNSNLSLHSLIWLADIALSLIQLVLLSVINIMSYFPITKSFWKQFSFGFFEAIGLGKQTDIIYSITLTTMGLALFLALIIYININKCLSEKFIIQERANKNKSIITVIAFIIRIIEFTVIIRALRYAKNICDILNINTFLNLDQIQKNSLKTFLLYIQLLISSIIFLLVGLFSKNFRMSWVIKIAFPFLLIFFETIVSTTYLIAISTILLLSQKLFSHSLAYGILAFLSFWGFIQLIYLRNLPINQQKQNQNGEIDLFQFGLGAIFIAMILIIKKFEILHDNSDNEDLQFISNITNKICQKQVSQLNDKQILRCEFIKNKFQTKHHFNLQLMNKNDQKMSKSVIKFSRIDFILFFYQKVTQDIKQSKKIDKRLLQLKLSILLFIYRQQKKDAIEALNINLIKCIKNFIEISNQKQYSLNQQYLFFVFEKQIIQKIKLVNENMKNDQSLALKVIQISNQSQKIYKLLEQILHQLYYFWTIMKKNTIKQIYLAKSILSIQRKKNKINQKLVKLQNVYPCKEQRLTFAQIWSLISRVYKRDKQMPSQENQSQQLNQQQEIQIKQSIQQIEQQKANFMKNHLKQISQNKKNGIKFQKSVSNKGKKTFRQQFSRQIEENQIMSLNYLMISDNVIKKISQKLSQDLKYNCEEIVNFKFNSILIQNFQQILGFFQQNLFKNKQNQSQRQKVQNQHDQSLILPLIDKNGYIIIYNCQIFLIPQFHNGLSILYSLQKRNFCSSLLICNTKNQVAIGVSEKFVQTFVNDQKIFFKENQCQLRDQYVPYTRKLIFPLQKYLTQLKLQNENVLKQINSVFGFCCCFQFFQNKEREKIFQIRVKMMKKYSFKSEELIILQILKDKKRKTNSQLSNKDFKSATKKLSKTLSQSLGQNLISGNIQQLKQKYKQQTFFCPIQNSFCQKIEEKQQFLKQSYRVNYPFYLLLLMLIWTFSYITYLSVYMKTRFQEIQIIRQNFYLLDKRNIEYQNLLNAIYNSYLIYHLKTSTNQEILDPYKINYQYALDYHKQKMNQKIKNFSKMYLSAQNSPYTPSKNLSYIIHFQNFQVEMNANQMGFLDFIVKLKTTQYGDNDTSIKFLLINFHQIIKAKDYFKGISQQVFIMFNEQNNFLKKIQYFFSVSHFSIIFGFIVLFTILILWLIVIIFKVQNILKMTCELLGLINQSQINQVIIQISLCRQQLSNKYNEKQQKQKKSFKVQDDLSCQDFSQFKNLKQKNKLIDQQKTKNICCQNFFLVVFHYKLILLVIIFIISLFTYQIFDILKSGKQYSNISIYKQSIYDAHEDFLQQMAQKYGGMIERYLNLTINKSHDPFFAELSNNKNRKLLTNFQRNLPQIFQNFYQTQNKYSSGNLCELFFTEYQQDPLFNTVTCNTVIKGTLEQGLARSMQLFRDAMKSETAVEKNFLQSYIDFNKDNQSNFLKMLYCYERLNMVYFTVQEELKSQIQVYLQLKYKSVQFKSLSLMAISILILGIGLLSYLKLKQRCRTCLRYFDIIPKGIIYEGKFTFFMQKSKYLELLNNI